MPPPNAAELTALLQSLYAEQRRRTPDDAYIEQHSASGFVGGSVDVFRFYEPYVGDGPVLDWGCRHAPDACLLRKRRGDGFDIHACDVMPARQAYSAFFEYARPHYSELQHPVRLPYEDCSFGTVVASGVLEHVPMDYESLKELYRVLRAGGNIVISYLPNAWSVEEWLLRKRGRPAHRRRYRRKELEHMLLHTGFEPLAIGYQTYLDLLPARASLTGSLLRPISGLIPVHTVTSCLCAVARKLDTL